MNNKNEDEQVIIKEILDEMNYNDGPLTKVKGKNTIINEENDEPDEPDEPKEPEEQPKSKAKTKRKCTVAQSQKQIDNFTKAREVRALNCDKRKKEKELKMAQLYVENKQKEPVQKEPVQPKKERKIKYVIESESESEESEEEIVYVKKNKHKPKKNQPRLNRNKEIDNIEVEVPEEFDFNSFFV